jgi:type IV fimbrial biogenesis protein FimT
MSQIKSAASERSSVSIRGVTAIELLMTLMVVMIVAGMATPSIASLLRNNQLASSVNLLMATLQMARAEALKTRSIVLVCPGNPEHGCSNSLNWHQGWIIVYRPNTAGQPDAGSRIVAVQQAIRGIRIQSSQNRRRVQFRPDGSARGSNLSLRFCVDDQPSAERAVVVNNSGRARKITGKALADLPPCRS